MSTRQTPAAPASTPAMPVADDVPAAVSEPVVPLTESEDLAGAFDRLQQDIDAAKPRSAAPAQGDITAALLAGLYESEKQPEETVQVEEEIPFDPTDISESDALPEAMAELELTEFQDEEDFDSALQSDEFNLLLEDELADISEPQYAVDSGPQYEVGEEPAPVSDDDLDLDREMLPEETDDAGFGAQIAAMGASAAVDERDTGETLSTDYDLDDGDENYGNEYDEENFLDEGEFQDDDLAPPDYDSFDNFDNDNSGRRGLIAASIVLGIAIVGGGGFYLWNSSLGSDGAADGPRVIVADSDPVKVKPENPGGKTVPNQDLAVYDKVSGNDTSASQDQNLITTTEEPVDVVQRTLDPDTLPLEGRGVNVVPLGKSEDRLTATADTEPAAADVAANTVAPRKVRTLIVKPDGTIVAREDPAPAATQDVASQQSGGSENPAVGTDAALSGNLNSSLAGASDSGATQVTALPAIDDNLQDSGSLPLPNVKPATGANENSAAGSDVAATVGGTGADLRTTMVAPVPSSRPAEQPVNIVEAVTERGNLAGSETTSNAGGYVMQISSQPTEEDARKSYENLSRRYASIIGDKGVDIQRAVIPDRGVFYRVRILAGSKSEASDLCAQYKSAGGSCFIAR
ncbi:MAG: SPOR domain-containing protein [Rhizobiaceae bacterium]|nr:SPOR domain-containing protein [Rhizobiaceae bacterium]